MEENKITEERRYMELAESIVKKWRDILHIDPLWKIDVCFFNNEYKPSASCRINSANSEYYSTSLEIAESMIQINEELFIEEIEDVVCHELIHLVSIDFYRIAKALAGDSEEVRKTLLYHFEQSTVRLQKSFMKLVKGEKYEISF